MKDKEQLIQETYAAIAQTEVKLEQAKEQEFKNRLGIILANPPPACMVREYEHELKKLKQELAELENETKTQT
jgi:hypothetical protein